MPRFDGRVTKVSHHVHVVMRPHEERNGKSSHQARNGASERCIW